MIRNPCEACKRSVCPLICPQKEDYQRATQKGVSRCYYRNDTMRAEFQRRLRRLISEDESGVTGLMEQLGMDNSRCYEWLNGKALPKADYLCAIADYYDCTIDWLLGREK